MTFDDFDCGALTDLVRALGNQYVSCRYPAGHFDQTWHTSSQGHLALDGHPVHDLENKLLFAFGNDRFLGRHQHVAAVALQVDGEEHTRFQGTVRVLEDGPNPHGPGHRVEASVHAVHGPGKGAA